MADLPGQIGKDRIDRGDPPVADQPQRNTLCDLTRDFALFTPALINIYGMFDRDPVREFMKHHPDIVDRSPFALDLSWPVFQGLGRGVLAGEVVNWDCRLYGIVLERWLALRDFIARLSWFDRAHYYYTRVGWHELTVVDQIALHGDQLLEDIPMVIVTDFVVSSNRQFTHLQEATDPPRTRAYPVIKPALPEILKEAEAVLGPPPNPGALGPVLYISHERKQQ